MEQAVFSESGYGGRSKRKDTDDEEESQILFRHRKIKFFVLAGQSTKLRLLRQRKKRSTLYEANKTQKVIRIPASIKVKGIMYKVTSIAPRAFKGNKK